ncbi:mannose-1-phosphate guanylyltransferase/mannose-6-phosphate isomerase [Parashewanella curva]|uniref:mannose-1-phosphate guanylyltransferase n=1 Tax=Parashewanella curva TaxID=2338552 RepID=A0A3L8Q285_9GAMM|nr:mannose-1-phosphate guanylyltransferase/mannose-6-phosphate isomerase [Parashewanella curva]RLV61109.1 mannose-1-phosphate guanylyltransferase/mannose-6-phosphate isomerase [Parashewanella curva]
MIKPIIMAGGFGTRLWPLSRQLFPKQFLALDGERSLLQTTIKRLNNIPHQSPTIICNEQHRFVVAEQLRTSEALDANILLEPKAKNTAPALALAAFDALQRGDDPILLVLASDHMIKKETSFLSAVEKAKTLAEKEKLVTFGVIPTKAETGFGYIKLGHAVADGFNVEQFVEKPDLETAKLYFNSKQYYWNSGMFMFKASVYLNELETFRPDIFEVCKAAFETQKSDIDFYRYDNDIFESCPDESIDYAVMENTKAAVVVPLDAQWSDVGSWSSLWDIEAKDDHGNVCKGDVLALNTKNSLISSNDRLVATIGLDDVVIVDTKDALLVSKRSEVQQVKNIVAELNVQGRKEAEINRKVYRPWGKYDCIDAGERFQVKRITVKPGAKLSLQMHHHRAEHWVVVKGTAKVTKDDEEILLTENQSTYIPVGSVHALENPGLVNLELIEVQSGSYLGEDDIVRYQDEYGRA